MLFFKKASVWITDRNPDSIFLLRVEMLHGGEIFKNKEYEEVLKKAGVFLTLPLLFVEYGFLFSKVVQLLLNDRPTQRILPENLSIATRLKNMFLLST
jgi:hypothetical protein